MTPGDLAAIRGRLEGFADDIFESLPRKDQRARGACYLRGLMLEGRRKSVEPMAQRLGEVHYQALHHFVAASPWDWRPVRRRLAERLVGALRLTAWAVDDTGFPKDGEHSVGVQRQYSGTLGKTANCQLGVSVNAVTEQASCPLDWRLFVPESWDKDAMAERRAACHLPEQVGHRPKWQLVLDMLDELAAWELVPPVLLADAGYGEVGEFRSGLDDRQIPYVVQVKADTSAYLEQVRPTVAPYTGRGRRPRPRYRDKPCSLRQLALAAGQQACVELIWRRGSKGMQRSRFLALRVRPAGITLRRQAAARAEDAGWELPVRWLLAEWPHDKPEPVKYWLANLPDTTPMVELVRLGKLRWRIEQDYRELKGALGLDHFEGRSFGGWHHHVTLVSVAHGFLTLERLRRPKQVASA
ncbi:MAG TPA: IS701 family transposase [Actinomycetes bacterium]|nr:IS701 family transposase [Actinomycetes bacterium]